MQNAEISERRLRRIARHKGYGLRKSRVRSPNGNNFGDYMLLDLKRNFVLLGSRYDATLRDVADYLQC